MWHGSSRLLVALALASAPAVPAGAQTSPSRIDADHSYAALWVRVGPEGGANVNVGVAQAAGKIRLLSDDLASSSLDLTIVPGGEGADLLAPDGSLRSQVVARLMRYTIITFQTTSARIRRDGHLEFSGKVKITHVTRRLTQSTGNSTVPTYTNPQITCEIHDANFVLAQSLLDSPASSPQKNSYLLVGARIDDFPQLSSIVRDSDWPIVAEDESCELFSGSESPRDYYGVICPGTAITTTSAFPRGELLPADLFDAGKHGSQTGDAVTILLHLKLASSVRATPAHADH